MKFLALLIAILLLQLTVFSQKQADNWYFGINAGINFGGTMPIPLTDSQMESREGCMSISDSEGKLLFYSNGERVWNRLHKQMPNGTDLRGNRFATQTALALPLGNNPSKWYLFTAPECRENGTFRYSVIDMSLNGGLGDVIEKNTSLQISLQEKITAVYHKNGTDIWLITKERNGNIFAAFLITESGLQTPAVKSSVGTENTDSEPGSYMGYMKVSPDGKKLALASHWVEYVEIFDFDNETGKVYNALSLREPTLLKPYGIEFSPDASKLYATYFTPPLIVQYDLQASDIRASRANLERSFDTLYTALQLAPDGKIYVGKAIQIPDIGAGFLGRINDPNQKGPDCNFMANGFYLGGRRSLFGLPTYLQSYFGCNLKLNLPELITLCPSDTAILNAGEGYDAYRWSNGSTAQRIPVFQTGTYSVEVRKGTCIAYDTVRVVSQPIFPTDLGPDTTVCAGTPVRLDAGPDFDTYLWNTGSTDRTIIATTAGKYWVSVGKVGSCRYTDTIEVIYHPPILIKASEIIRSCSKQNNGSVKINITGGVPPYTLRWSNSQVADSIFNLAPGSYSVTVTDARQCTRIDSFALRDTVIQEVFKRKTAFLCSGTNLILDPGPGFDSYSWSTGRTERILTVTQTGTYSITVTARNCTRIDTIEVVRRGFDSLNVKLTSLNQNPCQNLEVRAVLNGIFSDSLVINWFLNGEGFLRGDTATTLNTAGNYRVRVIDPFCKLDTSILFTLNQVNVEPVVHIPNAFSPNNDYENQFYQIFTSGVCKFSIQIYDNWGTLMFESDDPNFKWDGTHKRGEKVKEGVYVLTLKYSDRTGNERQKVGTVTVIY